MSLPFDTTVFSDPQGEAMARVYVVAAPTVPLPDCELASLQLNGRIVGPTCRYSSTLQAEIPFKHRGLTRWGDRTALVAEAAVPDPCYWSTDLPFLYRAVGEIKSSRHVDVVSIEQTFGIAVRSGVAGRIAWNGQVWVPRMVCVGKVPKTTPLSAWRDSETVLFTDDPSDKLLSEASLLGVCIGTQISNEVDAVTTLRRLSRYPAVAIALVMSDRLLGRELSAAAPNLLLARWHDDKFNTLADDAAEASFVFVDELGRPFGYRTFKWPDEAPLPTIAVRWLMQCLPLDEARAECDHLQRDLAGKYDVAGYLV